VNTVKGEVEHPYLEGKEGFTFEEDDSVVEQRICREVRDE
jgi:hypothetical protein